MYVFDTSSLPLLIIQVSGELDEADMKAMEAGMRWGLAAPTRYVCLTLARHANRPGSAQRKRIAEVTEIGGSNDRCIAIGIVVANELVAGALTAIRWISPSKRPEKSFAHAKDALAWLQPFADKEGLVIPEAARARAIEMDAARR